MGAGRALAFGSGLAFAPAFALGFGSDLAAAFFFLAGLQVSQYLGCCRGIAWASPFGLESLFDVTGSCTYHATCYVRFFHEQRCPLVYLHQQMVQLRYQWQNTEHLASRWGAGYCEIVRSVLHPTKSKRKCAARPLLP